MRGLSVLLALVILVPGVNAAWGSFHSDERNTGFQSGTAYKVYEDLWWNLKVDPATQMEASPVHANGIVVVGGWDKVIRALDATSGTERWKATMGATIVGTPAIFGGRLFVVDSAGALKAFDLHKGTILGTAAVGATRADLKIHEGKIFIGNEAGEMKAYDTETLTLLWKFSVNSVAATNGTCGTKIPVGQIRGSPAIYGGLVIFGSMNHWVYAINEQGEPGQTTLPQWIFKTNDIVVGSPMVDDDNERVIIGSYDEHVYSLPVAPGGMGPIYAADGIAVCSAAANSPSWTYEVPSAIGQSKVHSSPATDGINVYFGANNGRVYAITLSGGTLVWEYTTGGAVISSPAVSNSIVVVGSDDGKVYWLRSNNGTLHKSYIADSPIKSSPAIDGNRTFVTSFEGSVYMFGPKIPLRPDLQVGIVTYDDGVLSIVVDNRGSGDAGASTLRLTIDGVVAGDIAVPAIQAGQSATVTHEVSLSKGGHVIIGEADQAKAVVESEEANNEGSSTVTVTGSSKGKGGSGIPGPGFALLALALVGLAMLRRRR
ncbi:MAG: PQQ-binding-like beta-propeller repeat protein [Candidatus Thermoplasmatota archaeon]